MRHENTPAARRLMRSAAGFAASLALTGIMANTAFAQTTGILISGASPFEANTPLDTSAASAIAGDIDLDNTALSQNGLTGNLFTESSAADEGTAVFTDIGLAALEGSGSGGAAFPSVASSSTASSGNDALTLGELTALASNLNTTGGDLVLTLDLRQPNQSIANGGLGLDAAQLGIDNSVFDAVVENIGNVPELEAALSGITDPAAFNAAYNQILPEFGAAARQFILAGVDGTTGAVGSQLDTTRRSQDKTGGAWLESFAYFADRELAGQSEQYRGDGFGFAAGADTAWGPFHAVGINVGFSSTAIEDVVGQDDPLDVVTIQGGLYAGLELGKLSLSAYGGGGYSDFEQSRIVEIDNFFGAAQTDRSGTHINATLKAGYDFNLTEKYWIRPDVSIDYLRLKENSYTESGTFGIALDVDSRTSEIGSASGVINLGANFQGKRTWIKTSLRGGYKVDVINDPVLTSFRFASGNNGTADILSTQTAQLESFAFPDEGLLLGFTIAAGSAFSSVGFDFDSDIRNGFIRHTGRVVLRLLF